MHRTESGTEMMGTASNPQVRSELSSGAKRLAALPLLLSLGGAATAETPPPTFALCMACHVATESAASRIGPNLFAVVGRAAGSYPNFSYSAAMKASGIVWSAEELDRFLTSPQTRVPGTAMIFAGFDDPASRKEVIDYLQTLK